MILQIISMASRTGSFEVENWKLDIVKSHFSAEKKSNSQPAVDQKGSHDNVTSTTSTAAANSSSGLDSEVTSLIKEPRGSVPVTPSVSTPKKRLDTATHEEKGLGASSRDKSSSGTKEAHLQDLPGINAAAGKWGALEYDECSIFDTDEEIRMKLHYLNIIDTLIQGVSLENLSQELKELKRLLAEASVNS